MGKNKSKQGTNAPDISPLLSSPDLIAFTEPKKLDLLADAEAGLSFDPLSADLHTPAPNEENQYTPWRSHGQLRHNAPIFVPSASRNPSKDQEGIRHHQETTHRIRNRDSGTDNPQPPASVLVDIATSPSTSSTSSPTLSVSDYRFPSTSSVSSALSEAIIFRPISPLELPPLPVPEFSGRAANRKEAPISSVGPSADPGDPRDSLYLSHSRDGADIVITKPDEVERLFSFSYDYVPTAVLEEPPLVDISVPEDPSSSSDDLSHGMRRGDIRGLLRTMQSLPSRHKKPRQENGFNGEDLLVDLGEPVPRRNTPSSSSGRGGRHNRGANVPSISGTSSPRSGPSGRVAPTDTRILNKDYSEAYRQYQKISPYRQLLSRPSPRRDIPQKLLDHEGRDPLQQTLMRAWRSTEPTPRQKQNVSSMLDDLGHYINERLSWPGSRLDKGKRRFEVDVFGSVSWGGETGTSGDLDLVVLDLEMTKGYHPSMWRVPPGGALNPNAPRTQFLQLPQVYHIRSLQRQLADIGMGKTEAVISATTPIVKFKDFRRRLECDINVNDLGGWYNSSLILHYCLISPHVLRPLIHAIKQWAKAFEINDASGAKSTPTLSSYCYTLMAIAYLQHVGHLPNLQANVEAVLPEQSHREDPGSIWVGWGKEQGIKANVAFERHPPPGWKGKEITVAEALRGFFKFFNARAEDKTDRYHYPSTVVSILQGGMVPRVRDQGHSSRHYAEVRARLVSENTEPKEIDKQIAAMKKRDEESDKLTGKGDNGVQPRAWEEKHLVVQDPFLWHKNCAAALSKDGRARLQDAIEHTDKLLIDPATRFEDILQNPFPSALRVTTPRSGRRR